MTSFLPEVGKSQSPQIAIPQIPGLILLSQIHKFLRYASMHIANSQTFMINRQIANPQISTNTTQLCLKAVFKVVFL